MPPDVICKTIRQYNKEPDTGGQALSPKRIYIPLTDPDQEKESRIKERRTRVLFIRRGRCVMRRYKKKELLETVDMLLEAHEVICRLCKSNTEGALELLGQCQESAILLGNLIESRGEQYAELIKVLEDYCENIYQVSTTLSDENLTKKQSKKIQKQLIYLNNKIRLEMPEDKKEVVFFPYKASMWDSLESVWMAADADEDTDAYVVPIPYYDKNPDGSFREMHYEGNEYPDYVPVTDYKEYDFEERRPDVMYIHNPYDEFNYVTSVDPRYYSSNLKQFTDKLVYIPYFILDEINPDDDAMIEQMKHFCINSAVNHADKVIVQSENMRRIYIKVLTKESGGTKEAQVYWENKIDGSGSPKVKKVLDTKKGDLQIPENWMKNIRKSDGSFKKIVFYNTSVTALLRHDEQMLEKIESVFQTFWQDKDEIALLWRPHPLIESTLISMRPNLIEEYRKIRDKYINESWGIYDDSSDLDRAVVLSDAYYGDRSSVAQLFNKIHKRIMYQDANIINSTGYRNDEYGKKMYPLILEDCVLVGEQLYFVSYNIAALFSMNISTGEVKYIDRIPNEIIIQVHLIAKILNYKNILVLIPARTVNNKIWFYDLEKGLWSNQIFDDKGIRTPYEQFSYATIYNNELFVVGCYYPAIVCINLDNNKVSYYDVFENNLAIHSLGSCESVDNQLYIPSPGSNSVIIFDMKLKNYRSVSVGDKNNLYSGITRNGEEFWLSPYKNTNVVKWDGKGEIIEYRLPEEFQNISGYIFEGIASFKEDIWIYGGRGKSFSFSDNNYEKMKIVETSYLFCKKLSENIFIMGDYTGNIQIISDKFKKSYKKWIPEKDLERVMEQYKSELDKIENVVLNEDDFMQLDRFVSII